MTDSSYSNEDQNSKPETSSANKSKRGRPKWIPPDLKEVQWLASRGLTQAQIAAYFGISPDTLLERKKDFPGFSEAIKKGQMQGLADITNALYAEACCGNVTAAIFYLKNRDPKNWNDRREPPNSSGSIPSKKPAI